MKSSLGKPTKKDLERFANMQVFGCIACCKRGFRGVPGDIHHFLSGGRRISHQHTTILCPAHHRAVFPHGWTSKIWQAQFGPSLALGSKKFHEFFGTDEELLSLTNQYLERVEGHHEHQIC